MDRAELTRKVASLFLEAERTHGKPHAEREQDPEWALSYAQTMKPRMAEVTGRASPCVELVRVILDAEEEHDTRSPSTPWHEFYAQYLVDRCVAAQGESLALYYYPYCFYCRRVLQAMEKLGIQVELRDILQDSRHRDDLVAARGRSTVPVLRCTDESGHDRWMPESRDIVAYLERRFGKRPA